jgi:hypothetical protein
LQASLKVKQRQKEDAMRIEETQRLVTEIEMLKMVLYLVCRNNDMHTHRGDQQKREREEAKNMLLLLYSKYSHNQV